MSGRQLSQNRSVALSASQCAVDIQVRSLRATRGTDFYSLHSVLLFVFKKPVTAFQQSSDHGGAQRAQGLRLIPPSYSAWGAFVGEQSAVAGAVDNHTFSPLEYTIIKNSHDRFANANDSEQARENV